MGYFPIDIFPYLDFLFFFSCMKFSMNRIWKKKLTLLLWKRFKKLTFSFKWSHLGSETSNIQELKRIMKKMPIFRAINKNAILLLIWFSYSWNVTVSALPSSCMPLENSAGKCPKAHHGSKGILSPSDIVQLHLSFNKKGRN